MQVRKPSLSEPNGGLDYLTGSLGIMAGTIYGEHTATYLCKKHIVYVPQESGEKAMRWKLRLLEINECSTHHHRESDNT
jgi:hypothetical protein